MTTDTSHGEPYDPNNADDVKAVDTYFSFKYGWLTDPLIFVKYPDIMHEYITRNRLPRFTEEQSQMIKGSVDFLGLNHYTSRYIQHTGIPGSDYSDDHRLRESITDVNGKQIGPLGGNSWLYVYPQGIRKLVNWIAKRYNNPPLYIFENGATCPNESDVPIHQATQDTFRIAYLRDYIANIVEARILDKVNLQGYFVWSMLDNFEWTDGYRVRFGITYIDYDDNQTRYLKNSAYFYSTIIQTQSALEQIENEEDARDHFFSIAERF